VLEIAMRHAGFAVNHAETGAEALALLEANRVSAVLMDLGLPDGRSDEVRRWLHEHKERLPW